MTEVINFLTLEDNIVFTIALALMMATGFVSLIGIDYDMKLDADTGIRTTAYNGIDLIDFFNRGRLPLLASFALFLGIFSLCGYAFQQFHLETEGQTVKTLIAVPVTFFVAMIINFPASVIFGKIIHRNQK